jgi:hypothetical protein
MNILKRFVDGTPDQRAKPWVNVFLGTCGSESSDEWRRVCVAVFSFGVDGPLDAKSRRSYRVSGTKPQIRGPMVLPPAIAFLGRC